MSDIENDQWVSRRSEAGQWAAGTVKALATIAVSASVVWIVVSVISDSGLLVRAARAEPDSPARSIPSAERAYG